MKILIKLSLVLLCVLAGLNVQAESATKDGRSIDPTHLQASAQQSKALKKLAVLIKRRQYKQAYKLAEELVQPFEGEPYFDFLYGMAAIETQHFDNALFAFERLVLTYPSQPRYRLELARTHFYLRNLIRAEIEFKKIINQNPPSAVKRNVQLFLNSIADLNKMVEPRFYFAIDLAGGYDSNINSATAEEELPKEELTFPIDILLNDESRETGSSYWSTLLNFSYLAPISKTTSYDIRAVYSKRTNTEVATFNLDTAMLEAGYGFYTGAIKWRGAGRYQLVNLDGESFLNSATGIGQATWMLKTGASLNFAMNYGLSSYDSNPDGDMVQTQFTSTYTSPVKNDNWFFTFLFGSDTADNISNNFNAKSYQGFTYYSSSLLSQHASQYWMMNVISNKYDAINQALYSKLRKDTVITAAIGWRYSFNTHVSFRNDYSATLSDSSLVSSTYERFKVEFGLTYNF